MASFAFSRSLSRSNVSTLGLLYDASASGDLHTCRRLLDSGYSIPVNINETYGHWEETPLHIAVDKGHIKICLLLLSNGASTKTKDKWGRTPLHTASSKGHLRICDELLKADNAMLDSADKGNWTPLHMASSYGHRKICEHLIRLGCNINARTNDGTTALHFACTNSHIGVCRLLIRAGSGINEVNDLGRSALHFASKNAHSDICRFLTSNGADILAKDVNNKTPLDIWPTRAQRMGRINRAFGDGLQLRDYHQLLQAGSTPIKTIKLFLCGNPAAGKTSLKKALSRGKLRAQINEFRRQAHSRHCATPGISVKEKRIHGSGRFCIWDCAGQVEFHLTHSMFLGGDSGIFIIVYNCSDAEQVQRKQISYWMSFIKAGHDPSKDFKPTVMIVGTHVDQIVDNSIAYGTSKRILDELTSLFGDHLDIYQECFLVDTRRSYRGDMITLRKHLRSVADPLRGTLTPRLCDVIKKKKASWCCGRYPVLYWKELEERTKEIDRYCEEDLIETAINHLHDIGEIHRAKTDGEEDDIVILDPNWLTSAIFGPIFARPGLQAKCISLEEKHLYSLQDLSTHFAFKDTNLLVKLLLYFELAHWYDDGHLTIPSKLPNALPPVVWDEDPSYTNYTGRSIQCRDETDMIATNVFPCLQVRIMRRYNKPTHRPIISRMAIKFAHKVEGMVQLAQDRSAIMLAIRSKGQEEQSRQNAKAQMDELMLMVFNMLEQRSIGTQVVIRYLSPASLRRQTDLETDVLSYSVEDVKLAEEEGLPLIDPRTNNTESVADVSGPGYVTRVPNSILRWRSVLRATQDQLCSDIVPSSLCPHLGNIVTLEDEQVIKAKESNEGPIRAARLLVENLLASSNTQWPGRLLSALDNNGLKHVSCLLSDTFHST